MKWSTEGTTVKHWFRLMRAAEIARETTATERLPMRVAFFRREPTDDDCGLTCPWSPPVILTEWDDRMRFLLDGIPEHPQILQLRQWRDLGAWADVTPHRPSGEILH